MSFFEQIHLWAMQHSGTLMFGLIWVTITITAAICTAIAVGRVAAPPSEERARRPSNLILTRPPVWGQRPVPAVLILLGVFLICYITITLVWEDFAYFDDFWFTLYTLKGHNLSPPIWREDGRFWPFGLQEFNIVRHFTNGIIGYHLSIILQLVTFASLLLLLDDELKIRSRVILLTIALLAASILFSFSELWDTSERGVMLFLLCTVLSVKRFEETQSTFWALAAVVSAQIMLYNKEIAFVLLLGFAVSRLILRCRKIDGAGWRFDLFWARDSRLDMCLASLAVVFLILYFAFVGNANMHYADTNSQPRADVVLAYAKMDFLPWLLVTVLLGRIYMILRYRMAPWLLWDALAAGGVACFLSYIYLRLFSVYYLAPVDLIAVLYVGRFAVLSWKKMPSWGKIAAIPLASIIICQVLLVSTLVMVERKNVIQGTVEIASVVETQYRRNSGKQLRLFFPFTGGYRIMEFGAYLSSRGIAVKGADDTAPGPNGVVLAKARRARATNSAGGPAEDGPCVEWRPVWCQVVNGPASGDLVIVLPIDGASLAETSPYRNEGVLLLHSTPRLPIPQWSHWLSDQVHFWNGANRWMDGSVTLWK